MPHYSVSMTQTAYHSRQVVVPRSEAGNAGAAKAAAVARGKEFETPGPEVDDESNPWEVGHSEVDTRFCNDAVETSEDAHVVTVGLKMWVTRNEVVEASDEDAACDVAMGQATPPAWREEDEGWRLDFVDTMDASEPETVDVPSP